MKRVESQLNFTY